MSKKCVFGIDDASTGELLLSIVDRLNKSGGHCLSVATDRLTTLDHDQVVNLHQALGQWLEAHPKRPPRGLRALASMVDSLARGDTKDRLLCEALRQAMAEIREDIDA